jgi:hypothetical protein
VAGGVLAQALAQLADEPLQVGGGWRLGHAQHYGGFAWLTGPAR